MKPLPADTPNKRIVLRNAGDCHLTAVCLFQNPARANTGHRRRTGDLPDRALSLPPQLETVLSDRPSSLIAGDYDAIVSVS